MTRVAEHTIVESRGKLGMQKVRARVSFTAVLLLTAATLSGQSAEYLDSLLARSQISAADGAYLMVLGSGALESSATPGEALEYAYDVAPRFSRHDADDIISIADLSYLGVELLDVPTGLMYRLFPGPRYAYRESVYRNLVQGRSAPGEPVSGERALRVSQRFFAGFERIEIDAELRLAVDALLETINAYGLAAYRPAEYEAGRLRLDEARARVDRRPRDANEDFARAARRFEQVIAEGFPLLLDEKDEQVATSRAAALDERADVARSERFDQADQALSSAREAAGSGEFELAFERYQGAQERFAAVTAEALELRRRAEQRLEEIRRRVRELEGTR